MDNAKIVSLAENTSKVSTINLTVFIDHDETSKAPLGQIRASIAQIQLLVPVPFVLRTLVSCLIACKCCKNEVKV